MLSFFRKYERTFLLIVFAPGIVAMGMTGLAATVLQRESVRSPGRVFGERVSPSEWEMVVRPYSKIMRQQDEGANAWRFFAFYKAAERAGIRVPDSKLAEDIVSEMSRNIAQLRVQKRLQAENVDTSTPEGMAKFRMYYLEALQNTNSFTEAEYRETIERSGFTVIEFEAHQRREKMFEQLTQVIHDAGTILPEDIWKKFREAAQTRSAELVTIDASAYVPTGANSVTDAEAQKFWESNKELYDEPRRVDLEYVAAPFEKTKLEIKAPTEDEVKDYYEKHKTTLFSTTSFIGTAEVTVVTSYSDAHARCETNLADDRTHERAEKLIEAVAAKLDEQRKSGKIDMAAAMNAVAASTTFSGTKALETGKTGLLETDQISTHPVLNGFAALRWANTEKPDALHTSEPLRGEKCVCVLRTNELKEKRSPPYDEVKARVHEDYWKGNDKELKRYYEANSLKYRTKDRWKVQLLVANFDKFAADPNLEEPGPTDLDNFWSVQGAKLFPNKQRKDVSDADLKKAHKLEQAKQNAKTCLRKIHDKAKDNFNKNKRADLDLVVVDPDIKKTGFLDKIVTLTLDRDELAANAYLKKCTTAIPIAAAKEASEIYTSDNDAGEFLFVIDEKLDQKAPDLAEVRDQVAKDMLLTRGFDRARDAADKLLAELKDLKGDALKKKLEEKKLASKTTPFFERSAPTIPGLGTEASRVATETFFCEVDAGFERRIDDKPNNRIILVRCAARKDPPDSDLAKRYIEIRRDLLSEKRSEFARVFMTELELRAKGITPEHVKWVRQRREGQNGEVTEKVRQVFIPDDKATLDAWLDDAARKVLEQAQSELKRDVPWQGVVLKYSDDTNTRANEGSLENVTRGELVADYGAEFEDRVFNLAKDDQVSAPIKSKKGWHLVKVTKAATFVPGHDHRQRGGGDVRMSFKHLLVKTDPVLRQLPPEIAAKAHDIARGKAKTAQERLAAGEPFTKVGSELGAEGDARAKGETFTIPYLTAEVRMALRQDLEPAELDKVKAEEIEVAGSKEWHLMLCQKDPNDKEPSFKAAPRGPRLVFETVGSSQDAVMAAMKELQRWQRDRATEGKDPSFPELMHEWKRICSERSTAPSAKKEGAFGHVQVDQTVRTLDDAVVATLATTATGQRTPPLESKDGFRIIEVVSVETKKPDDMLRDQEVGEDILLGTDWADER